MPKLSLAQNKITNIQVKLIKCYKMLSIRRQPATGPTFITTTKSKTKGVKPNYLNDCSYKDLRNFVRLKVGRTFLLLHAE